MAALERTDGKRSRGATVGEASLSETEKSRGALGEQFSGADAIALAAIAAIALAARWPAIATHPSVAIAALVAVGLTWVLGRQLAVRPGPGGAGQGSKISAGARAIAPVAALMAALSPLLGAGALGAVGSAGSLGNWAAVLGLAGSAALVAARRSPGGLALAAWGAARLGAVAAIPAAALLLLPDTLIFFDWRDRAASLPENRRPRRWRAAFGIPALVLAALGAIRAIGGAGEPGAIAELPSRSLVRALLETIAFGAVEPFGPGGLGQFGATAMGLVLAGLAIAALVRACTGREADSASLWAPVWVAVPLAAGLAIARGAGTDPGPALLASPLTTVVAPYGWLWIATGLAAIWDRFRPLAIAVAVALGWSLAAIARLWTG